MLNYTGNKIFNISQNTGTLAEKKQKKNCVL